MAATATATDLSLTASRRAGRSMESGSPALVVPRPDESALAAECEAILSRLAARYVER